MLINRIIRIFTLIYECTLPYIYISYMVLNINEITNFQEHLNVLYEYL